jgi:hypothetical protein
MPTFDSFGLITRGIRENFRSSRRQIVRPRRLPVLQAYVHERKYCISREFPEYGMSGQRLSYQVGPWSPLTSSSGELGIWNHTNAATGAVRSF